MLKNEMRASLPILTTEEEAKNALLDAHNGLKNDRVKLMKLVESMPRRLAAVIEAEGGPTKFLFILFFLFNKF